MIHSGVNNKLILALIIKQCPVGPNFPFKIKLLQKRFFFDTVATFRQYRCSKKNPKLNWEDKWAHQICSCIKEGQSGTKLLIGGTPYQY
jgi:hypothetical protein